MIDFSTLNVWQKFECYNSSFKRETEIRLHCYVNIARVLYLLTNNVKKENYHFFYKGALEKQDKRIDWFINNIINKKAIFDLSAYQYHTYVNKNNLKKFNLCLQNKKFKLYIAWLSNLRSIKITHVNHSRHKKLKNGFKS